MTVEGIDWSTLHTTTAYDLDVEGIDTFYVAVGTEFALVHNCDTFSHFLDDGSGIYSTVEDGVLIFAVEAKPGSAMRGRELFDEMLPHHGSSVRAISGNWTYGDNLAAVNRLTAQGVPLEQAVTQTWTAAQARRWGFVRALVDPPVGTPGSYTSVEVLFTRWRAWHLSGALAIGE